MSYTVTPEDGGGGGGGFPGYGSVSSVGTVNNDGVAATVARSDHIHAHDNQPGGTLHALDTNKLRTVRAMRAHFVRKPT